MKYLFILGRNPELSILEIKSFFEKENNKVSNLMKSKNSLLVECEKKLNKGDVNLLGGVISIGEVLTEGNINDIKKNLDKTIIYPGEKNKFNYVIWNLSEDTNFEEISEYLKKRFKEERLKSTEKKISGFITLQNGKTVENVRASLIDEQFFIFGEKEEVYFGRIIEECDYETLEKRDMLKPFRRESLSISPRLAKIMINLSQVKRNEKIVDPFCGIGVILYESLTQGIKVIGIDRDKTAIQGTRINLEFGNFQKTNYKLILGDSKKLNIENANVIVCEPELGILLKKMITEGKARDIISTFEDLIINVINNLKKNISGRIVFTTPLIKTVKGRISCNVNKILRRTNLKIIKDFPIQEFRKDQIVGREIFVLER